MVELLVFFSQGGKPQHVADPSASGRGPRRFMCGRAFPKWWHPEKRHLMFMKLHGVSCNLCNSAISSLCEDYNPDDGPDDAA